MHQNMSDRLGGATRLLGDTLSAQFDQAASASLISGMIQANLDALALMSQQIFLSPISVLEGYPPSSLASDFSDCIQERASDMQYLFPMYLYSNDTADNASSSATVARRMLRASTSGTGGNKGSVGGKGKGSNETVGFNGYQIISSLSGVQYNFYDRSKLNPVKCLDASCHNVILGGLFLHTILRSKQQANLQTRVVNDATKAACSQSRFATLIAACRDDNVYLSGPSLSQDLGPVGSDPVFNPSTPLYNPALSASDFYNMSSEVRV